MLEPYLVPILILAIATTGAYFHGRKKNRWIGSWISTDTEEVLKPKSTNYVNFGGAIGYNSTYTLGGGLTEAKGTFTLLPRQSLLYLPLSLLIARHDRYYLTIFSAKKLLGEGHVLRSDYFRKARSTITGLGTMRKEEVLVGGAGYVLVWDRDEIAAPLKALVEGVPRDLLHFCCYRDNKNFFLYVIPRKESLAPLLRSVVASLPSFFA